MNYPYPIIQVTETASTNEHIRQLHQAKPLSEGTTVVAAFQTHGRGQMGNGWESEPDKNLLFSTLLLPAEVKADEQFILSQLVAVSLQEALEQYIAPVTVKWPNDIYYGEKKLAGVLIENDLCGKNIAVSIVGIGLNVNQEIFVSDAPNPVSLKQILGTEVDKEQLLCTFLTHLRHNYALLNSGKRNRIQKKYRAVLFRREGFFPFRNEQARFSAQIDKVDPMGYLHLITESGERRKYFFKEVSFVLSSEKD